MAKKVPVTVYVDPEMESEFTIKPFAGKVAVTPQAATTGQLLPEEMTNTASATATVQNDVDADMDVD